MENNKQASVASENSLRPVDEAEREGVKVGDAKEILDDMDKFQREIEELMRSTGAK